MVENRYMVMDVFSREVAWSVDVVFFTIGANTIYSGNKGFVKLPAQSLSLLTIRKLSFYPSVLFICGSRVTITYEWSHSLVTLLFLLFLNDFKRSASLYRV